MSPHGRRLSWVSLMAKKPGREQEAALKMHRALWLASDRSEGLGVLKDVYGGCVGQGVGWLRPGSLRKKYFWRQPGSGI